MLLSALLFLSLAAAAAAAAAATTETVELDEAVLIGNGSAENHNKRQAASALNKQIQVGDTICTVGYIMDHFCIQRGTLFDNRDVETLGPDGPIVHSVHCLIDVPSCINSPFEILFDMKPGGEVNLQYGRAFRVENNDMLVEYARKVGSCADGCTGSQKKGLQAAVVGEIVNLGSSTTPAMIRVEEVLDSTVGCSEYMVNGTILVIDDVDDVPRMILTGGSESENDTAGLNGAAVLAIVFAVCLVVLTIKIRNNQFCRRKSGRMDEQTHTKMTKPELECIVRSERDAVRQHSRGITKTNDMLSPKNGTYTFAYEHDGLRHEGNVQLTFHDVGDGYNFTGETYVRTFHSKRVIREGFAAYDGKAYWEVDSAVLQESSKVIPTLPVFSKGFFDFQTSTFEGRWMGMTYINGAYTTFRLIAESTIEDGVVPSAPVMPEAEIINMQNGHFEVVAEKLIEEAGGADINIADTDGRTPLHWASQKGHLQTVKKLIEAGADINAVTKYGRKPIDIASLWGHKNVVEYLKRQSEKQKQLDEEFDNNPSTANTEPNQG